MRITLELLKLLGDETHGPATITPVNGSTHRKLPEKA
jgi:hypothetical protein